MKRKTHRKSTLPRKTKPACKGLEILRAPAAIPQPTSPTDAFGLIRQAGRDYGLGDPKSSIVAGLEPIMVAIAQRPGIDARTLACVLHLVPATGDAELDAILREARSARVVEAMMAAYAAAAWYPEQKDRFVQKFWKNGDAVEAAEKAAAMLYPDPAGEKR